MLFASLVFAHSPTPFTYSSELPNLEVGDLVAAPLRGKVLNGIVIAISETPPKFSVKPIAKIVRKKVLADFQIEAARFIREYYSAHAGKVLKLFIPQRVWKNEPLKRKAKKSEIKIIKQPKKKLTPDQAEVLKKILETESWKLPALLHGITGSGKTEIYLRAILEVLQSGKQAILLVPEIALTPQLVGYFAASIPKNEIAVLHSNLSEGEKLNSWEQIHSNEVKLVIGSRSALFAPARKLGIIILDEEHEWNYKNDQTPRYHARAVAFELAKIIGAKLILGSATPSLETYFAAQNGRLELLELPERVNRSKLPEVRIVDLRNEMKRENFSPFSELLQAKIREKLERKEQIILLLNKRGFSSAVVCRDCGFVLSCENCSLPLTFHRALNRCVCHGCGYFEIPPASCPNCHSATIRFLGTGTQKIESELPKLFPGARILRADRDTTSLRGSHQKIYEEFRERRADILIGTQIVAKGLDLPNVSLVGVLLADIGLHLPDFRAGEKIFSLLTQVAGRCGRGEKVGEVVIQTYSPEHPALQNARNHDYKKFFREEIAERKNSFWPPFSKVVKFIFVDEIERNAKQNAENFAQKLKESGEKQVWTAPALIAKLNGKFHFHVIWKGGDPRKLLAKITLPEKVRVDVDPVNLC
ncbi:primosomal protein N' [Patescibacteria group bacterium]|nr:primosomal protein N' [Patescibacteria group bacterium]